VIRFAGRRFARSESDLQMVFLYDVNGFIAGMQSPVPVANTDNQYFDYDASAAYNKDTIAGVEVLTIFLLSMGHKHFTNILAEKYHLEDVYQPFPPLFCKLYNKVVHF
jgi:hypothetical protein